MSANPKPSGPVRDSGHENRSSASDLVDLLSTQVSRTLHSKIDTIEQVMRRSHILALNASIEAARAGEAGRGFAIIASEMREMSQEVNEIARLLQTELGAQIDELRSRTQDSVAASEDIRLIDLSLNAIELIDRNLYERSCDVRWWATDAAVVACAANPGAPQRAFASERLGVILGAYTVYRDIWLCDAAGRVIASGRPRQHPVEGADVSRQRWFRDALVTRSGDEFVCADVERCPDLGGAAVATYAAAIRPEGDPRGKPLGVLGIHFDWAPQAAAIVRGLRLTDAEWGHTRAMLLDRNGRILASSDGHDELSGRFPLDHGGKPQGSYRDANGDRVGFALTPGYETYKGMGWYGCVVSRKA